MGHDKSQHQRECVYHVAKIVPFLSQKPNGIGGALLLLAGATALSFAQAGKTGDANANPSYTGSQACMDCHSDLYKPFQASRHWKTTLEHRRGPAFQGCESCHGPGKEHVDSGGDPQKVVRFSTLTPAAISERCLSCHAYTEEHSNFQQSVHRVSKVSCLNCHSIHHEAERQFLLRTAQPQLCQKCHAETRAEFRKPFHHRVEEKLVRCTDCHNQHGSFLDRKLRTAISQEQVCSRCHKAQTGPFTFEHAPVKVEGCTTCHAAHGSANPRLLKRPRVNTLCLECHTFTPGMAVKGTPPFHNQAERHQACTLCHIAIHGSDFDRKFLK